MFKLIFLYEGHSITILSQSDDKIQKSIESLLNKINLDKNDLYFIYMVK